MNKTTVLVMSCALGLLLTQSAQGVLIYSQSSYSTFWNGDRVETGAGDVNNSAMGAGRTLIVEYDMSGGQGTNLDSWFGIAFGLGTSLPPNFYDTLKTDTAGIVRTGYPSGAGPEYMQAAIYLDEVGSGFGPGPSYTSDAHVRYTLNLSSAGILANESATAIFEIDDGRNGSYDWTASGSFTWDSSQNYIYLLSKSEPHTVANLFIYSVPEPSTVILLAIGGFCLIRRRFRP